MKAKISYGIFLLITIVIFFITNITASFYLVLVAVVMPVISAIINKYAAGRIKINIEVKNMTKSSTDEDDVDNIEIMVECTNNTIFPVFRFEIAGKLYNYLTFSEFMWMKSISIPAKKTKVISETIESVYCGRVEENLETAYVYDFLGLSRSKIKLEQRKSQYVFPKYEKCFDETQNMFSGDELNIQDKHIGKKGNDIMEILNLREYTRGDNIKNIHWKLSKKIGKKIVKELDTPAQQDVVIFGMLSDKCEKEPEKKDRLVRKINAISQDLLTMQVFHDMVLFDEKSGYADCVNVENEIGKDGCIEKILDGGITFEKWLADEYMVHENVMTKYAKIIIVSDGKTDMPYDGYGNIEMVFI